MRIALGLWCALTATCSGARSQDSPVVSPPPEASGPDRPSASSLPEPITIEQLAARLQAMEVTNRRLAQELERTRIEHEGQLRQILDRFEQQSARPDGEPLGTSREDSNEESPPRVDGPTSNSDTPVPDYTEGQFQPNSPAPGFPPSKEAGRARLPLIGSFGPAFQFQTEDERFRLQVHYESQIEGRSWQQGDQVPNNSGIYLPRQRIFFNGNITKPIEYEFSINRGFGAFNLLNAYINVHFDDRLEIRVGRFFTPFNYDQYAISNYWLPTPERSLFTTNVGLNRQFGLMAWGYLFGKRLDYAAGFFNGSRNSFENIGKGVDFVAYLNARPFQDSETFEFARFLNLGTSFAVGHQDQSAVPMSFRVAGGSPNADVPGPGTVPFLILNRDVVERGDRLLGSVHSAYYHKGLSLIGEWQYGYGNYSTPGRPSSAQIPFSGFYVSGGYFLTGEHVERRSRVTPLRPFIPLKKGDRRGPGAWEIAGRVSELRLGKEVFTAGFADPNLWSNRATTTELGLNWYWNDYVKIYSFWLHGKFGDPVQYRPGGFQTTADMFWLRFQLYF